MGSFPYTNNSNPNRKTKWDLISGRASDGEDILINSSFHRYISENLLNDFEISPIQLSLDNGIINYRGTVEIMNKSNN